MMLLILSARKYNCAMGGGKRQGYFFKLKSQKLLQM